MSKWTKHRQKWSNCQECDLCGTRKNVVLYRGKIPCDILFVGDAPGVAEDDLGKPFIGPAGHLLNRIIKDSIPSDVRLGFTNLIGCIPIGDDGHKTKEPSKKAIKACNPRLKEIIEIAKPSAIVTVGKLSTKYVSAEEFPDIPLERIMHPAAILRADVSQQGLAIQRCLLTLEDLHNEVIVPF